MERGYFWAYNRAIANRACSKWWQTRGWQLAIDGVAGVAGGVAFNRFAGVPMWPAVGVGLVAVVLAAFLSLVVIMVKESAERDHEQTALLQIAAGGRTAEQLARRNEDLRRLWRQTEVLLEEFKDFKIYFLDNPRRREGFSQSPRFLSLRETIAKLIADCSGADPTVADRYREHLLIMRRALSRPGLGFDAIVNELDTASDELWKVVEEDESS